MFFNKPVSKIEYEDIEALTSSEELESIILDYKKTVSGAENDKKEIAKDICALANSQGGYLIVGVEERNGKPIHPPCGTVRMIGRQKVEEWVEQIANSNIAQRVNIDFRVIDFNNSENCILVLHVPMSNRMPHMVTYQRDNKYYRRYFKRHQFESLPAEEYEVREMFEKGTKMTDRLIYYLASNGYGDPSSFEFAENTYTRLLGIVIRRPQYKREIVKAEHFVTFVACPNIILDDYIDTSRDEFWNWLDRNNRRYPPDIGGIFLPAEKRPTLDGIVLSDDKYQIGDIQLNLIPRFLRINRNGYLEMGCSLANKYGDDIAFAYVPTVGYFGQFINFVVELYRQENINMPFKIMLNMKGTENALLYSLGKGWLEPIGEGREYRPHCIENNIQIIKEIKSADIEEGEVEKIVREVATQIDNAWGQREPRCFNNIKFDPQQQFPASQMRGFF